MEESGRTERIQNLLETIMKVAQGDYSVQNEISPENDDIDALAMGFNMMIDELRENLNLKIQNERIKAINEELHLAKEKAQESDRLKSAFLANMSHEIRSPLNAILGFAGILKRDEKESPKKIKYLNHIENAGNQLIGLINDIIDISKIESDQLTIFTEESSVRDLLSEVILIMNQDQKLKAKPGLKLIPAFETCKNNCFVNTDIIRFKQIFINLISNALKFTDNGYIEVGWLISGTRLSPIVTLYVKDTGIGIPPKMQSSIFDRFSQAHTDRFQEGAGLGLSIVKGLVKKLGGEIMLESEVDKGSVFYISFPCRITDEKVTTGIDEKTESINLANYLVYVAEDSIISYTLLEEILKPWKLRLVRAENGKKLLELIEKQVPDFVFLDLQMPVMDGFKTISEIRKRNYTFPVVAQTSYAMADERIKSLNLGCNGYITKPIDPDELISEMQKLLPNQKS